MDREKRRLAVITIFLLAVIFLGDFATGAIAIASGPLPAANACTSTNGFCPPGPIAFHTAVFGNSSMAGTITTGSWTTIANETMMVVASVGASFFPSQVTSVSDTLLDSFTLQIRQFYQAGSPDFNELEVWTAKAGTVGLNAVTVNWNISSNPVLAQVASYTGVASIGAKTNTTGLAGTGNTITVKTVKSGSWIWGVSSILSNNVQPVCTITTSSSFTRRLDSCTGLVSSASLGVETEISDNATALRDLFSVSYAPTWVANIFFEQAVIELVPIDLEPITPDFTTFCTITASPCTYLNFVAKATGPNSLVNIVVGTAYCTGVTSTALTSTIMGTHGVIANGQYNGQSRNDTGAVILVQLYTSVNAPSTVFGAGLCAAGGTIVSTGKITFDTSGATLTAFGLNEYATANVGTSSILGTGSLLYEWYEITPQSVGNVNTGIANLGSTIQYAQWGSHCVLQLGEVR